MILTLCTLSELFDVYYDGYKAYTIEELTDWNGTDHVFRVIFECSKDFNRFLRYKEGSLPSDIEDHWSMFDIKPYIVDIVDISYTVILKPEPNNE